MYICLADAKWENEDAILCRQPKYDIRINKWINNADVWAAGYYGDFYKGTLSIMASIKLGGNLVTLLSNS